MLMCLLFLSIRRLDQAILDPPHFSSVEAQVRSTGDHPSEMNRKCSPALFSSPLLSQIRVVLGQQRFNVTDHNTKTFGVDKYIFPNQFSVFNPTLHDIGNPWAHNPCQNLQFLLWSRFLTAMFVLGSSHQTEETGRALCEKDAVHQPHLPPRKGHQVPRLLLLRYQRLGAHAREWVTMSLRLHSHMMRRTLEATILFSQFCRFCQYLWGHHCPVHPWTEAQGYSSLQEAGVRLIPHDTCRKPEVYSNHVTDGMLCAGLGKCADACQVGNVQVWT